MTVKLAEIKQAIARYQAAYTEYSEQANAEIEDLSRESQLIDELDRQQQTIQHNAPNYISALMAVVEPAVELSDFIHNHCTENMNNEALLIEARFMAAVAKLKE